MKPCHGCARGVDEPDAWYIDHEEGHAERLCEDCARFWVETRIGARLAKTFFLLRKRLRERQQSKPT